MLPLKAIVIFQIIQKYTKCNKYFGKLIDSEIFNSEFVPIKLQQDFLYFIAIFFYYCFDIHSIMNECIDMYGIKDENNNHETCHNHNLDIYNNIELINKLREKFSLQIETTEFNCYSSVKKTSEVDDKIIKISIILVSFSYLFFFLLLSYLIFILVNATTTINMATVTTDEPMLTYKPMTTKHRLQKKRMKSQKKKRQKQNQLATIKLPQDHLLEFSNNNKYYNEIDQRLFVHNFHGYNFTQKYTNFRDLRIYFKYSALLVTFSNNYIILFKFYTNKKMRICPTCYKKLLSSSYELIANFIYRCYDMKVSFIQTVLNEKFNFCNICYNLLFNIYEFTEYLKYNNEYNALYEY